MHQNYARSPPPTASPASSPWTNPSRTNNSREPTQPTRRTRSTGAELQSDPPVDEGDSTMDAQQPRNSSEDNKKLNQVLQNYFYKAFLVVVRSRMNLPDAYSRGLNATKRVNRWFNIILDETDAFREDVRPWKSGDHVENPPGPLVIETYLDTSDLLKNQILVALDGVQKPWNVSDALNASGDATLSGLGSNKHPDVVLERWQIDFDSDAQVDATEDIGAILPTVYKRSIVLFRSLFLYARFLPAWKYSRRAAKLKGQSNDALKIKCRVVSSTRRRSKVDGLSSPLIPSAEPTTEEFVFGSTETPAGTFTVKVTYRTSCDFRIDDSELVLSSQFLGMEEPVFQPSLGSEHMPSYMMSTKEIGSMPTERSNFGIAQPDRSQAYGSMSTFHQVGPTAGTSPLSALRNARDMGEEPATDSPGRRVLSDFPVVHDRKEYAVRPGENRPEAARRPSVSFKPFKSGSLSASPLQPDQMMPPPPVTKTPLTGAFNPATHVRSRPSSGSIGQSALRSSIIAPENAIASSASGSPRPAPISKYTSSFSNRKPRLSSGGASKTEDEGSSGKASLASSAHRGSGLLNEAPAAGSESLPADADIEVFIKMLDQKKNLKSFEGPGETTRSEASTKRTSAALSKFQKMRESNNVLSESISSSLLLQRSSTSSSRQLSSVPQMFGGASISTSSSPGKPVSPHTPNTPAIPSRLSANQSIDYGSSLPRRSRTTFNRRRSARSRSPPTLSTIRSEAPPPSSPDTNTTAIDIPTSPPLYQTHIRRSSSVVADHRAPLPFSAADHIDPDGSAPYVPFVNRSSSMGAPDRDPPSLSALLAMVDVDPLRSPPADIPSSPPPEDEDDYDEPGPTNSTRQPSGTGYRGRGTRGRSSRISSSIGADLPSHTRNSSSSSLKHTGPSSSLQGGMSDRPGRPGSTSWRAGSSFRSAQSASAGANVQVEDEDLAEPLLFAMSELGAGRRSLEELRAGSAVDTSASSSRRELRRGGRGE